MTDANEIEVRGAKIPVQLQISRDGKKADFVASYSGSAYRDTSWEGLRTKLMHATKRASVKIEVPFLTLKRPSWQSDYAWVRSTATGVHASTKNILVRENGSSKTEQVSGRMYDGGPYFDPNLTVEQQQERVRLAEEAERTRKELETFDKEHTINLRSVVEEAIEDAARSG